MRLHNILGLGKMLRKFDQLPKQKFMCLPNVGGDHNICNNNVVSFVSYCLFVTNLRMYMWPCAWIAGQISVSLLKKTVIADMPNSWILEQVWLIKYFKVFLFFHIVLLSKTLIGFNYISIALKITMIIEYYVIKRPGSIFIAYIPRTTTNMYTSHKDYIVKF